MTLPKLPFYTCLSGLLLSLTGFASAADDEAILWNQVEPLTAECEAARTDGNEDKAKAIAMALLDLEDIPYGLIDAAEDCVNKYSSHKAAFTFEAGWQPLMSTAEISQFSKTIVDVLAKERQYCGDLDDGQLDVPPSAVQSFDLTGDGNQNTVIDAGHLRCSSSESFNSGSGGSRYYLIVEEKVTSVLARNFSVVKPFGDGFPIMVFVLHGSSCGGYGADNCVMATVWNGNEFRRVEN